MSESSPSPSIYLEAEFIRDLTLENNQILDVLNAEQGTITPKMFVDVFTQSIGDDRYYVTLKIKLEFLVNNVSKYLIEMEYVGRCVVQNANEDILPFILNLQCPGIIFPAARHMIGVLTQNSGLPPFNLQGIDFEDIFRRKQEALKAQSQPTAQA